MSNFIHVEKHLVSMELFHRKIFFDNGISLTTTPFNVVVGVKKWGSDIGTTLKLYTKNVKQGKFHMS